MFAWIISKRAAFCGKNFKNMGIILKRIARKNNWKLKKHNRLSPKNDHTIKIISKRYVITLQWHTSSNNFSKIEFIMVT